MRSIVLYLFFLVGLFLFSSCAVHAHFPFICFRGECIKDQWTISKGKKPDVKAFKKRLKAKTKVLKKKATKKKTHRNIEFPELPTPDTLQAPIGNTVVYTRFILFFRLKGQKEYSDTASISYTSEFRDIMSFDKDRVSYMLQKINPGRIEEIYIREIIRPVTSEPDGHHMIKKRERAVRRFLNTEGVQKAKIKIVPRPS